jgi:hypothetical protein
MPAKAGALAVCGGGRYSIKKFSDFVGVALIGRLFYF